MVASDRLILLILLSLTMHCCTDVYVNFPYTSPLPSGVLRVSGEAGTSTHKPQMNYLQWADVVVASTKLIKPAETHHFIWRFLFFWPCFDLLITTSSLAQQMSKGRGSIVSHADSFQTKQPPPSLRPSI